MQVANEEAVRCDSEIPLLREYSILLARLRHLWTNESHQLLGCIVVQKGLAQNHGSPSIAVIGSQRHESLVCRGTNTH